MLMGTHQAPLTVTIPQNIYDDSPGNTNFDDNQHANTIDFSATDANLQTVFTILGNNMDDSDLLFIWANDHGSNRDAAGNHLCRVTQYTRIVTLMILVGIIEL